MASRRPPDLPPHANLDATRMRQGIARIEKVIGQLEAFDPQTVPKRWSTEVEVIQKFLQVLELA